MDAEEFDELYEQSFRPLVRQIYAMCGDVEEARDCVQEAFVRAWSRRRSLDAQDNPQAWVRTTARRLAISRWRQRSRALGTDRAMTPAEAVGPADPDHVALVEALKQLPVDQREALVLHHLADLSVAEVAAEVGAKVGTVKARLSRGRAALAELLSDNAAEGASRA